MTVFKKDKGRQPGTPGLGQPLLVASGTQNLLGKTTSYWIYKDEAQMEAYEVDLYELHATFRTSPFVEEGKRGDKPQ